MESSRSDTGTDFRAPLPRLPPDLESLLAGSGTAAPESTAGDDPSDGQLTFQYLVSLWPAQGRESGLPPVVLNHQLPSLFHEGEQDAASWVLAEIRARRLVQICLPALSEFALVSATDFAASLSAALVDKGHGPLVASPKGAQPQPRTRTQSQAPRRHSRPSPDPSVPQGYLDLLPLSSKPRPAPTTHYSPVVVGALGTRLLAAVLGRPGPVVSRSELLAVLFPDYRPGLGAKRSKTRALRKHEMLPVALAAGLSSLTATGVLQPNQGEGSYTLSLPGGARIAAWISKARSNLVALVRRQPFAEALERDLALLWSQSEPTLPFRYVLHDAYGKGELVSTATAAHGALVRLPK